MVMGLEPFGQFAYRGPFASRKPAYVQQQLVLKMGDAVAVRRLFAEPQEAPELIAEVGERLEIFFAQGG